MPLARLSGWTLLLAAGFALLARPVAAQDLPRKNSAAFETVTKYKEQQRGGIPKAELPAAQKAFEAFASYYAEMVTHPSLWKAPLEFKPPPFGTPPAVTIDALTYELDTRYLLVPLPENKTALTAEPADYIRELGAALDKVLRAQIETHPDPIVRVNTARLYAHVCRTGAPAHYATVTALLANANVRGEIKNYVLHAAAALLSAYDPNDLRSRRHSAPPKVVGELVETLQKLIENPVLLLSDVRGGKLESATPDQLAVVAFLRRQAVKALAQVRYVSIAGADGTTPIYPVHTLARVALADPALGLPPTPAEAAEVALGLLNAAPVVARPDGTTVALKGFNAEVVVEALCASLVTFASPRAARVDDRTLPWRSYAGRIADAMRTYRLVFDPNFDPLQPNRAVPTVPPAVDEFVRDVTPRVLAPMDKTDVGSRVEIEALRKRLQDIRANPKRNVLIVADAPKTSIAFPPGKN